MLKFILFKVHFQLNNMDIHHTQLANSIVTIMYRSVNRTNILCDIKFEDDNNNNNNNIYLTAIGL